MIRKDHKLFRKNIAVLLTAAMAMSACITPSMAADVDSQSESIVSEAEDVELVVDSTTSLAESETPNVAEPPIAPLDSSSTVSSMDTASDVASVPAEPEGPKTKGTSADINAVGSVKMYRMYNPNSGEHFYTSNENEVKRIRDAGWTFESIGWIAPEKSNVPVYRLYNPNAGDHHYTIDVNEKNNLVSKGWKDEGIGWYSAGDADGIPLLRQYNPNAKTGAHNFTTSAEEDQRLVKLGWKHEGIGWYGIKGAEPKTFDRIPPKTIYAGRDYSDIYDFNYFRSANPDIKKMFSAIEDEKALAYFVNTAIWNGVQAKEGVTCKDMRYRNYRYENDAELKKIDHHSSSTNYLISVNLKTHTVYVYQGGAYRWKRIYTTRCTSGAAATPTRKGVFKTRLGGYYFDSGSVRCFYFTPFDGSIYFHSVLYAKTSTPSVIRDGRLGYSISHGCVRLPIESAKWIYDRFGVRGSNVGTTVVVY